MTVKVGVDNDLCQGHARCFAMSPLLTIDDDGYSDIGDSLDIPADDETAVRRGVAACPEKALSIAE